MAQPALHDAPPQRPVEGQRVDRLRQRAIVVWVDDQRRRPGDLDEGGITRDHGRAAARHRLERRHPEALVQRWQHEAERAGIPGRHLFAGDALAEDDVVLA
jgi:hypothetical protein